MTTGLRAKTASLATGILALFVLGGAMPASAVTTNALRDNYIGTVPIITVTATMDRFTCPTANCSAVSVRVDLDSIDNNALSADLREMNGLPRKGDLKGKPVYLWWINGPITADLDTTNCSTSVPDSRTYLTSGTFDTETGQTSLVVDLPPSGPPPGKWTYGTNWLCATTVSADDGGLGGIGDLMVTVSP